MGSSLSGWTIGIPNSRKVRVCVSSRPWPAQLMSDYPIANGQPFHFSFISFFRLHVRLFLNTLPLQPALTDPVSPSLGTAYEYLTNSQPQHRSTSLQGLTNSYKSALQTLQIITQEFAPWGMLVRPAHPQF